jgi:hypothetical protein
MARFLRAFAIASVFAAAIVSTAPPALAVQTDGTYWQTITPAEQKGIISVAIDALRDGRNNYVYHALQELATTIDKQTGTKNHVDWDALWKKLVASQPTFSRSQDYYAGESPRSTSRIHQTKTSTLPTF